MKKFVLPFIIIAGLLGVYYYMSTQDAYKSVGSKKLIITRSQPNDLNKENEELTDLEKAEDATSRPMVLNVNGAIEKEEMSVGMTDDELDKLEEYFDRIENEWEEEVKNLFVSELNVSPEIVKEYFSMRNDLEMEKDRAFRQFHEEMKRKHGENYAYSPSADQEAFEEKILESYYQVLKEKLGEEKFVQYLKVKETFNDRLRAEQNPTKGVLFIEF